MDVKIAQANTDKFLLPKPVGTWKKPYRPRSSLLSSASLVKAQMAQTTSPATLALALAKVISTPSICQFCQRNHNQESARDLDKSSKQKPFKCQFCQEIFSISCLFIAHMENHTGKSLYRCEFCGILFVDFFSMIAHRKDHLTFPCKLCSQKFVSSNELAKHMTSVHSQKKKVSQMSKLSKKAFSLKVDLILQQNTNVLKPIHTCEICYKSFPLLSHLLAHKKCHTKEKPYKCDVCGKNFKHSTVLKIHQQQHTGSDMYVCEHCGRVFSQCRHLASHIRTHSKDKMSGPIPEDPPKSSPLLLTALLRNSPPASLLQPGQIVNASGAIENLIPAHSKGKVPFKITDPHTDSLIDAPLDFRQQTSVGAVRNSVIHQVGGDSNVINQQKLQLNTRNSGKMSSLVSPTSVTPISILASITEAVNPTSVTSVINTSSIAPVVVSSSPTPVLVPTTVSSIINPVSLGQMVPTSPMPVVTPVSLTTKINPEIVTSLVPTSAACSDMTEAVEIQRPASAEAQPISSKIKAPVLRSASTDQATVKDLRSICKLPLKLKLKEEPEKWLTNRIHTAATITSSTPSSMKIPESNLLKIEKMDTDTGVLIKSGVKNSGLEQLPPIALVKCEPMEVSQDTKPKSPVESAVNSNVSNEIPPDKTAHQSSNLIIVPTKLNDQGISDLEQMDYDNVSEKGSKINKEITSPNINANDEAPLSLVKKESVPNSLSTLPLKDNLKKEHLTLETSNMPNNQISSNICMYCKKTHNKELINFLESNPGDKPFKCHFCAETFSIGCLFSKHIEEHTGKILYQCDVCHKIFEDFLTLIFHRKTMHQGYVCNQCSQVFVCESDLKRHTRLVHYVEKTYDCEYCGKSFLQKCNLTFHKHTHTGEQPYRCEECGRKFARPGSLNAHMRTHSRLKPHKCEICDKAFNTSGRLRCHIRLHICEMSFKCDLCDRSFPQSKGLKEHLRSEHTGEKLPYECEECGKCYMYSYMLIQHRLSHRGKNILKEVVTDTLTTHKKTELNIFLKKKQ